MREETVMEGQMTPIVRNEQIKYPQSPIKILKSKEENSANNQNEERKKVKKTLFEERLQKREKDICSHKRFTSKKNESVQKQPPRTSNGINHQAITETDTKERSKETIHDDRRKNMMKEEKT